METWKIDDPWTKNSWLEAFKAYERICMTPLVPDKILVDQLTFNDLKDFLYGKKTLGGR